MLNGCSRSGGGSWRAGNCYSDAMVVLFDYSSQRLFGTTHVWPPWLGRVLFGRKDQQQLEYQTKARHARVDMTFIDPRQAVKRYAGVSWESIRYTLVRCSSLSLYFFQLEQFVWLVEVIELQLVFPFHPLLGNFFSCFIFLFHRSFVRYYSPRFVSMYASWVCLACGTRACGFGAGKIFLAQWGGNGNI